MKTRDKGKKNKCNLDSNKHGEHITHPTTLRSSALPKCRWLRKTEEPNFNKTKKQRKEKTKQQQKKLQLATITQTVDIYS